MALAISLHLLASTLWVGGMWLMLMAVRPAAVQLLDPPLRLPLLNEALRRFFRWVWLVLLLLPATGLWMLFSVFGGFAHSGWHIHAMLALFLVMAAIFVYLYFAPYAKLQQLLAEQQWPQAGQQMGRIRRIVMINAVLGALTLVVASGGRYLG